MYSGQEKKLIKYEIDMINVTLRKEMAEVVYYMFGFPKSTVHM